MNKNISSYRLLSNGDLLNTDKRFSVINPFNELEVGTAPVATLDLLDDTVNNATRAFKKWSLVPLNERKKAILKLADVLDNNIDLLGNLLTQEQGKPIERAKEEVVFSAIYCRYFANVDVAPEVLQDNEETRVELSRVPLGVVACICPWNFPLLIAVYKLAPAILMGNTVIVKPAPTTPLTVLKFGELARSIFPAGVLNILSDEGDLGPHISNHPNINMISFTGSTSIGKEIMASASGTLKRLILELGGNDPAIVLDDANPKDIAQDIFNAAFFNSGQVCIALKRLYVHSSIYEHLCDAISKIANDAIAGDGMEPETQIGPIQNRRQFERIKKLISDAKDSGAKLASGGNFSEIGFSMRPTIIKDIDASHPLVGEEQFGPVLPIVSYDDLDELIENLNQSEYGLGASIWSTDESRALQIGEQLICGTLWINQHLNFGPNIPLPTSKQSGTGTEWGEMGLLEYTRPHVVNLAKSKIATS
jgi:acyl-CoA reductase-like NAD-dependent aldehyde dehydrogenase